MTKHFHPGKGPLRGRCRRGGKELAAGHLWKQQSGPQKGGAACGCSRWFLSSLPSGGKVLGIERLARPLPCPLPWSFACPCPPSPESVLVQDVHDVAPVVHSAHILAQQLLLPSPVLGGLQTLCGHSLLSVGLSPPPKGRAAPRQFSALRAEGTSSLPSLELGLGLPSSKKAASTGMCGRQGPAPRPGQAGQGWGTARLHGAHAPQRGLTTLCLH